MIKEGDDFHLVDVPANKIVAADVIRSGDTVFIRYSKPKYGCPNFSVCKIYTTEKWAFPLCLRSWPWQRDFMDVLVRLKLMSKERRSELLEIDRQRATEAQRKYDLAELQRISGRYYGVEYQASALIAAVEKCG